MNLVECRVIKINSEARKESVYGAIYELNIECNICGKVETKDVVLLETEYNMIKERGYYLC